jgi:hypothetical protein
MKDDAPILIVDYCRVADKYEFLESLSREIAPRRIVVADGVRTRHIPADTSEFAPTLLTPPRAIFRRSALRDILIRPRPVDGMDEARFRALVDHLTALIRERRNSVTPTEAARNLIAAHRYTAGLVQRLRPALTIVWNQFHPLSLVAEEAVRRHGGNLAFIEYGLLPGTLNFDFRGQMGESAVACDAGGFEALPIDDQDRATAIRALTDLKATRANRRPQPRLGKAGERLRARANGRPIVLFAGHNDHASGIVPWDDNARRHHSPFFESSAGAAEHLAAMARENDWFLLYKPHPFATRAQNIDETDHLAVLGKIDINDCVDLADCVVTVLSQTSYVALIREKPLVMLGYNQLRDRGFHYSIDGLEDVGPTIDRAIREGFTPALRASWVDHVARLLKYYLYAYRGLAPELVTAGTAAALARRIETAIECDSFVDF